MNRYKLEWIKRCIRNCKWSLFEKKQYEKKYGTVLKDDNKIKKCYMIFRTEYVGLFSYVETVLRQIAYAIDNNYCAIVDMTGIENPFLPIGEEINKNWWELYFQQPMGKQLCKSNISLQDVISCEYKNMSNIPYGGKYIYDKKSRWFWGKMYSEFFRLNSTAQSYFEEEYKRLMHSDGKDTLGVLIRGTDYKTAKGHPIQPSIEQITKVVRKKMHRYQKIYVATEEYINVEKLMREFPEKVIVNSRMYYDKENFSLHSINDIRFDRKDDKYWCGMEYLSSIMLLSKCGGLVCGICGGSAAAIYINNGQYRDLKCFYLGINE